MTLAEQNKDFLRRRLREAVRVGDTPTVKRLTRQLLRPLMKKPEPRVT